jgi:hypothetical protein
MQNDNIQDIEKYRNKIYKYKLGVHNPYYNMFKIVDIIPFMGDGNYRFKLVDEEGNGQTILAVELINRIDTEYTEFTEDDWIIATLK